MAGKVQFLQRGASCIHQGLCFSIPPASYFREAELLSAFSCGFSLMKHLRLRSKNRLKVKRSPCHQTNQPTANWERGLLCLLRQGGAGACCTPSIRGQKGSASWLQPSGCRTRISPGRFSFLPAPLPILNRSLQKRSGLRRGMPRFLAAGCAGQGSAAACPRLGAPSQPPRQQPNLLLRAAAASQPVPGAEFLLRAERRGRCLPGRRVTLVGACWHTCPQREQQ